MTPPILPTDFPRGPRRAPHPARQALVLPGELACALALNPQRARVLLLAAWVVLLHRYTRQEELSLAVNAPEGSGIADAWMNDDMTGEAVLAWAESALSSLSALSGTPAASDCEALPVALSLHAQAPALDQAGHGREWHLAWPAMASFKQGILHYDAALFLPATVERLQGHLVTLLNALRCEPQRALATLPILTEEELAQLARMESGDDDPYPLQRLHRYVEAHAARQPDVVAVSFNDQRLSYAELERRANRLAHYLRSQGVEGGRPVAVYLEPSLDFPMCLLAIFKACGAHVPLDPSYPAERLAVILNDTAPAVVLTQAHLLSSLPEISVPILCPDRDAAMLESFPSTPSATDPALDQPAFIVYTSGTTGRPKGVVMSHASLIHYVLSAQRAYGFGREDVFPAIARFSFSITMFEVLSPLVAGGRLMILERAQVLDFKHLTRALQESTVVHASPSLLRKLLGYLEEHAIAEDAFARLRHISSGGDIVPPDLLEKLARRFPQAELFVIYGSSEIGCMGCSYPVPRTASGRTYVGKPFKNVTARLYDSHGQRVPIGVAGEIHFSGPGLALGYLNQEALTAEKFTVIDGRRFYRMGDMGRLDDDGNLEILGRNDFQIKLRGIRIELTEIETVLRQAPGVRESAVALRELTTQEKGLVAYVAMNPACGNDLRQVHRYLQAKLPDYMLPSAFVVLDALPVNLNQKLDRRALPAPTAVDFTRLRTFVPPRNQRERKLAEIWESVLDVRPIGIRDNFFEVGGDSLLSVSLMTKIETAFGARLPLHELLFSPTVEHLATLLDSQPTNAIERKIHGAFTHALALVDLEIDDDLRALGASPDQLEDAFRIIENDLGYRLPSDILSKHHTVRILSTMLRQRTAVTEPIPLNAGPDHRPLFLIAGVHIYRHLALRLEDRYKVLGVYSGLELLLFESAEKTVPTVAELARDYLECILRYQPEGPYRLAGMSFGGILAYEVAQQLQSSGHQVAFLGLFDTMLPETAPWSRAVKLWRLLRLSSADRRRVMGNWLSIRRRRASQALPAQFARHQDNPALAAMERLREEAYAQAAHSYVRQVRPYAGMVTLVVARQRLVHNLGRTDCGWRPYVQRLNIHTVNADHLDMMEEPKVADVVDALRADLERAEAAAPPAPQDARGNPPLSARRWWKFGNLPSLP